MQDEKNRPKKFEMNYDLKSLLYWFKQYFLRVSYELTESDFTDFFLRDYTEEERAEILKEKNKKEEETKKKLQAKKEWDERNARHHEL